MTLGKRLTAALLLMTTLTSCGRGSGPSPSMPAAVEMDAPRPREEFFDDAFDHVAIAIDALGLSYEAALRSSRAPERWATVSTRCMPTRVQLFDVYWAAVQTINEAVTDLESEGRALESSEDVSAEELASVARLTRIAGDYRARFAAVVAALGDPDTPQEALVERITALNELPHVEEIQSPEEIAEGSLEELERCSEQERLGTEGSTEGI